MNASMRLYKYMHILCMHIGRLEKNEVKKQKLEQEIFHVLSNANISIVFGFGLKI